MSYDIQDFETEVIQRSYQSPMLVDFWAEWCAPCRMLSPILERLAEQNDGIWVLAKVNTEEHQDVAGQYQIQSIPNVKLFFEGKVAGEFVGALPEYAITQWLRKSVPSKNQRNIELAKTLMVERRFSDAQSLLENILDQEQENQQVKVLLAKLYLFSNTDRASQLIKNVDDPQHAELSEAIRTLVRLLAVAKDPDGLPDKPARQKYVSAIADVRSQNFEKALEKLIEVIREDRNYDDDGSRKACIALFKFLGEEHPMTQKYRREFSSALYI